MFSSMPSTVNFSFFFLDILLAGGGRSSVGIVMGEGDSANELASSNGSGAGLSSLDLFLLRERLRMIEAGEVGLCLIGDTGTGISIKLTSGDG